MLILAGCYLPGIKGGGPIRTIANLVEVLGDEFEFSIITMDRDLGDKTPYQSVNHGQWNQVGKSKVYYINSSISIFSLAKLINSVSYDVLYLNSFFNTLFSFKPIFMSKLGVISPKLIVLAPRGEFSNGALNIKPIRKRVFIFCVKVARLYRNVLWHASTNYEKNDILNNYIKNKWLSSNLPIHVASNMSVLNIVDAGKQKVKFSKNGSVKICFLSRVSPMKNLNYLIDVLSKVKSNVFLGIYGPIESQSYWNLCLEKLKQLPSNIEYNYFGMVPSSDVQETIFDYDIFFVPTKGENFGHVFIEALSAGVPILVSDKTPWRDLEAKGVGWDISLHKQENFVSVIDAFQVTNHVRDEYRRRCIAFATQILNDNDVLEANRRLFLTE